MNINPLIIAAANELGVKAYPNNCPCPTDSYIVFGYLDERPLFCADDEDINDITTARVHWFARADPQPLKKALRKALRKQGFLILSTVEFYENDTKLNHIAVDLAIDGDIDD